jgi:antitoxin component of RelBE/YafQ-DinJ toxin-antitoxin module
MMEEKRLVVQISRELHAKFKAETAIVGITMSDAIIALIKMFLENKSIIDKHKKENKK